MKSDALLDYAVLQLSPKRSRCELLVSSDGNTEKLSSGLLKPFLTHLKVSEEQAALAAQSIKLEIGRQKNVETWFTKGTLQRFVQFVSTPEVLEMVNTFDAEMSQLEAARRIYSQGAGDQRVDSQGGNGTGAIAAADSTTKELLRAIDVRLGAVRQDLSTSCARASASGFNPHTISQLQRFAQCFHAHRLNEACTKYMSLYERRPDLIPWNQGGDDRNLRSSVGSDMSIDTDDGTELGPHHPEAHPPDPPKLSTWQQPKPFATFQRRSSNINVNQKDEANDDSNKKDESPGPSESSSTTPASGPAARRLSVQDRINLFENKQKENSSGTGSGSGPKPVVGKSVELRRMSSDVSLSTEKSVLRRWSGISDMSIDVSGEKKDNDSPLCTPSSVSSVSQTKSNGEEDKDHNNDTISNSNSDIVRADQGSSQGSSKFSIFDQEERTSEVHLKSSEVVGRKSSQLSSGVVTTSVMPDVKSSGAREEGGMKNHMLAAPSLNRGSQGHSRSRSAQFEGGVGVKLRDGSVRGESGQSAAATSTTQPRLRSFTGDLEEPSLSSKQQKGEDSEVLKMKYQKPQPGGREQIGKLHGKRDEIRGFVDETSKLNFPGKEVPESQDYNSLSTSTAPPEQVQRVRQSKGNQGLHDDLKMKADELEKLFAEHKLRVPVDQSGSARRIEPADAHVEQGFNSQYGRPGLVELTPPLPSRNTAQERSVSSSNAANSDAKPLVKTTDGHEYGDALQKSFSDLNFGDDSRGKYYEKYMKKRYAKLKEEWSSNRAEKDARMKAIQDSLEQSRAELEAKFSGSVSRQGSVLGANRTEKLRYFKSNVKRDQHPIDSLQNDEDEDLSGFSEEKIYATSRQSRKNLPNRHMPSGPPRTTATSISRSSGRRRDNPLAQSVPNFSDLRKENTKPSSGVSKTTRFQVRNYARSKSTTEETQGIQEEKPKRTQSLRKSSANPAEFKDLPPLNSDGVVLTPLRFDMDQTDLGPYDRSPRSFLKKGNGTGSGSAGNAVRMKDSMASGTQKNEEFEELESEVEDSLHMATEEQDVIETMAIKGSAYNSNGKVKLSQESEKSGNSGSEIGDSTRSLSQVDPNSAGGMPTTFPSTFNSVGSLQDSPVESPEAWNSHMRHPFSYPHESSDIDASVDSPIGSPASWNSHSLTQVDNDAARMRKKWGSAQKPFLVPNTSQNQPRKDVTRGFKRLLKFGRKSRGSESLVDWISATTSEGDDDAEDGRDLANRSSEDLRKSRMGFSHGHPSDDSFNESELFNDQVQSMQSSIPAPPAHFKLRDDHISGSSLKAPKSFFSLSTFRSKGSDSKPR